MALAAFIVTGVVFCLVALIIKYAGTGWINVVFPPAVMGAIVALIGLELVPVAAGMAGLINSDPVNNPGWAPQAKPIILSMVTLGITVIGAVTFRGFPKIIHILIGIVVGYILGYSMGLVNTDKISDASFISLPTVTTPTFDWSVILTILPVALVVIVEHIGHLLVTSSIVGRDLSKDPGLHRSLLGNGVSTILSGFVGSTPNTTYGENIGVMALTRVYSIYVIGGAAVIAILLSFSGTFSALVANIPVPVMGGVSLLLFGLLRLPVYVFWLNKSGFCQTNESATYYTRIGYWTQRYRNFFLWCTSERHGAGYDCRNGFQSVVQIVRGSWFIERRQ